jgi:hypothetical protein
MNIIKPIVRTSNSDLQDDDPFIDNSHGLISSEFTLCGVACEEWDYVNYTEVKTITCKDCLSIIKECKSYKGGK